MNRNESEKEVGILYIVSTPIGNLEDITLRALRILKTVDLIAAEDTKHTSILLKHYDISCKLTSYHIYNEHKKTETLINTLINGKNIALVSDAGTPCIADPGFLLVREALKNEIPVEIIPGPSSLTFAVCACGLPVHEFSFFAFPPVKKGARKKLLEKIKNEKRTAFLFIPPHKLTSILDDVSEIMSPDTRIVLIREATKLHEEIIKITVRELINSEEKTKNIKGEIVMAIHP